MTASGQPQDPAVANEAAPELSLIIPCLNEEQNVVALIERLSALVDATGLDAEILIVDDCSDDYTFREALLLSQANRRVVALHKGLPRGIGNAIRFAIDHARGRVGVIVMGDGVDPLAAIPDMREAIVSGGADLVLLSRYAAPGDADSIPLSYRVYQRLYRLVLRALVGVPLRDPTYAFRAFRLDFVRSLGLSSAGFEISPEITVKTWNRGGRITELSGRQGRRIAGESKFIFSQQGAGYARVALAGFFERRRIGR